MWVEYRDRSVNMYMVRTMEIDRRENALILYGTNSLGDNTQLLYWRAHGGLTADDARKKINDGMDHFEKRVILA